MSHVTSPNRDNIDIVCRLDHRRDAIDGRASKRVVVGRERGTSSDGTKTEDIPSRGGCSRREEEAAGFDVDGQFAMV